MPQVQELIKQVLYEKISSVSSQVIIDALIATGNEALVNAILAKSLTPQQAEMLKQVAIDPQVAAALAQVKGRLLEGVDAASANFQNEVVPKVTDAAVQVVQGSLAALKDEIDDIPGVGAVMGVVDAATTGIKAVEDSVDIGNKVSAAIAPVQAAMGQIGTLTDALNAAASSAASGLETQASSAANQASSAANQASSAANQASSAASELEKQVPLPPKIKGGSRTRRRIHKLSRRIERTLRRVQKKYGLQDKNSFLRRTLKRK
jgi:hypothetical protein